MLFAGAANPRRAGADVVGEGVAHLGCGRRIDWSGAVMDGRVGPVGFSRDETAMPPRTLGQAAKGPTGLVCQTGISWHSFAKLRLGIAVELQHACNGRAGGRQKRAIAGRGGGKLRDVAPAHLVVNPAGQPGLAGGRAKGGDVEAVVVRPLAASRSTVGV